MLSITGKLKFLAVDAILLSKPNFGPWNKNRKLLTVYSFHFTGTEALFADLSLYKLHLLKDSEQIFYFLFLYLLQPRNWVYIQIFHINTT